MRVAINQVPFDGPWGGGNRFVSALVEGLKEAGHQVQHNLGKGVDLILIVETRLRSPNVTFDAGGVLRHLAFCDRNAIVVHRINECDERKGERFITHRLLRANYAADFTVFVGSWLMDLPAWRHKDRDRFSVILNGADPLVFNPERRNPRQDSKISLVTHHWSSHPFKGYDVYRAFDDRLDDPSFAAQFDMTFVGNIPNDGYFRNIKHIKALNGPLLSSELKRHSIYLTASICEPGGNHQNEGALCGLPLLYRNSGCLPEYCDGFGEIFDGPLDVFSALDRLVARLPEAERKMRSYPHTSTTMVADWISYLSVCLEKRDEIVGTRKVMRKPLLWLRNQVPL